MILFINWIYACLLTFWIITYHRQGDAIWWSALLMPFTPLLFSLLLLLMVTPLLIGPITALLPLVIALLVNILVFWRMEQSLAHTLQRHVKEKRECEASGRQTTKRLTVMTFNLWWRSESPVTGRVALDVGLPDIILLQELTPQMAMLIEEAVGNEYPFRQTRTNSTLSAPRLGVYSQIPFDPVDATHLESDNFRLQIVRLQFPDRSLLLYNVHPRATNLVRYWREGGSVAEKVRQSFYARAAGIANLLNDIEGRDEPVIVAGDFNSVPFSDVYRLMGSRLTDMHKVAGRGFGHTFPNHSADFAGIPLLRRFMRLDMIFCSHSLAVHACQVSHIFGESDHCPVIAELSI